MSKVFSFILLSILLSLSGCSTGFKPATFYCPPGQSGVMYSRQGSIPESAIYRDVWPISPMIVITNEPRSRIFEMPVIGVVASAIGNIVSGVSKITGNGSGKCYTYRDDLVIIGTNITAKEVGDLLEKTKITHTDAQRSGWLPSQK